MESEKGARTGDQGAERYRFGNVVVDALAHTISRDQQPIAVEPKAFAVLLVLLRRPDQLIPRDELLDAVWGHRHVTPGVLTRAITQLRAALGDDPHQPRYIQTQHALGYRFVGDLGPQHGLEPAPDDDPTRVAKMPADAIERVDIERAEAVEANSAPATAQEQALDTALPYSGDERRGRRFQPWQWIAIGAVMLGLVGWLWQQRRDAPVHALDPSIAVLPFTNLGGNRDDDYFAEGLAVEMHDALAGVKDMKVAAQVSPLVLSKSGSDMKTLGALLGVSTVLDASVRREGDRVRINARLTDCGTGYTLWSRTYDRQLSDVFDTQVEIANAVARSLVGVLPKQQEAIAKRLTPTRNAAAFDAYLRGLVQLLQPGPDDSRKAIGFFNQALSADRGFSRAQAGVCRAEVANFINSHDVAAFERAQVSCTRAAEMDPGLGDVNLAIAELHDASSEYGKAVEYYTRAESDPASRPAAYVGIAIVHASQGREAQAMDYFNRALALRPGDARIHAQIGYQHYLAGKLPEAIASYHKSVELQPGDALMWSYLGGLYLTAGKALDAERALAHSIAIEPTYSALTNLGEVKYLAGRYADAVDLSRRAVQLDPSDHLTWGNLAQAQLADPATAGQAVVAFSEAAERAQRYVDIKTDDAKALAALGWYRANLGQDASARQLIARSEAMGIEPGEVALYNAQTLAQLGDAAGARKRIAAARAAGIVADRIDRNPVLRKLVQVDSAVDIPDKTQQPAPSSRNGHT